MYSSSLTLKYEAANSGKYANKPTNRVVWHFCQWSNSHEIARQSLIH